MNDNVSYMGLDRAALDAAYNNRELVANSAEITADWEARSQTARETADCVLDVAYGPSTEETLDVFRPAGGSPHPVSYTHLTLPTIYSV